MPCKNKTNAMTHANNL